MVKEFNEMELSAIKEVGNIATAHAANPLAQMLGLRVRLVPLTISFTSGDNILNLLEQDKTVAVVSKIYGKFQGEIFFIFDKQQSTKLMELLKTGKMYPKSKKRLDILLEIANVMAAACFNAVSRFIDVSLIYSLPQFRSEKKQKAQLLKDLHNRYGILAESTLLVEVEEIQIKILLFASYDSLQGILKCLSRHIHSYLGK